MGQRELPRGVMPQRSSEGFIDVGQWERNDIFFRETFKVRPLWGLGCIMGVSYKDGREARIRLAALSAFRSAFRSNTPPAN